MKSRRAALLFLVLPLGAQEFTAELWKEAAPVYSRTTAHPFLKGLSDGTLPRDRFQFYLTQDRLYLRAFGQALAVLASRAPKEEWAAILAQHSIDAIKAESELHQKILGSYGITDAMAAATEMAPSNLAYTNHLHVSVAKLSFIEGLGAMLPCYWVYQEVGRELVKRGSKNPDYQRWIDQYASEDYGRTVRQVLQMMNEAARHASQGERRSAKRLFVLSTRYEFMFWDMAWRKESWVP